MNTYKIKRIDNGFCIILYSVKNENDETIFYGLQDGLSGIELMRCTRDGEPSHGANFNRPVRMERPTGESEIECKVRDYINDHELIRGI